MEIRITHKNAEVSEQMREFIEEKCSKLERFAQIVGDVDIVLKMGKEYVCFAEINLPIKGTIIHGEAEAGDVLSSFEEALDKVERQVKKYRDKMVEHKGRDYDNNRTS
jgi:putative sigma-54 modulation protein